MIRPFLEIKPWSVLWPLAILVAVSLQEGQIAELAQWLVPIYTTGIAVLLAVKLADQLWYYRYWLAGLVRGRPVDLHTAKVRSLFDSYAMKFDRELRTDLEYRGPEIAHALFAANVLDPGRLRIADLGCGTGLAGVAFAPNAEYLTGCDLSQRMLDKASALSIYDELHREDLLEFLTSRTNAFELVIAVDSLIYVTDPWPVYLAAFDSLQPGGWLLVTTEIAQVEPVEFLRGRRREHEDVTLSFAGAAGFERIASTRKPIRLEAGKPVEAGIMLWRKPR